MEIGQKIKLRRQALKMSQEQVANEIHISRQTLSNWGNNHSLPDIVSILQLSDLYQLSLDELLKGDTQIMHKLEQDQKVVKKARGLTSLTLAMGVTVLAVILVALAFHANLVSISIFKITVEIIIIALMIISAVANFRFHQPQTTEPIFQKRVIGYGWSINPRNVWGLVLYILVPAVLIVVISLQ